jgi:RNA polymerase sigma-70 factor (ECF subfamily)
MATDDSATSQLLKRVQNGDSTARDQLFRLHRPHVSQFVAHRCPQNVRQRIDDSDVVQDVLLHAARRLDDYVERRPMPFRLWLLKTAYERLIDIKRFHIDAERRTVRREVILPEDSSQAIIFGLVNVDDPASRSLRDEVQRKVREELQSLNPLDQQILMMRYVEEMPYDEIACILGIEAAAARKRHTRAIVRLGKIMRSQD